MKMMIISDIHGSYDDLVTVMKIFDERGYDKLIILGDILYHGPRNPLPKGYSPRDVVELLNGYKDKIIAVRGNCDSEVDQMVLDFPMRADYIEIYVDQKRFFLTHGHIYNEEQMPLLNKGDVFMNGHFHVPVLKEEDVIMFNPSSISLPKQDEKSFGTYEDGYLSIETLTGEVKERKFIL